MYMEKNYVMLSKTELEQLLRNTHLSGQNHSIMGVSGLVPVSIDDYVSNEISKIFTRKVTVNTHTDTDGWGGC